MSKEKTIEYCPGCSAQYPRELGKTVDGYTAVRCGSCETEWLIKDATGRLKVTVEWVVKP